MPCYAMPFHLYPPRGNAPRFNMPALCPIQYAEPAKEVRFFPGISCMTTLLPCQKFILSPLYRGARSSLSG